MSSSPRKKDDDDVTLIKSTRVVVVVFATTTLIVVQVVILNAKQRDGETIVCLLLFLETLLLCAGKGGVKRFPFYDVCIINLKSLSKTCDDRHFLAVFCGPHFGPNTKKTEMIEDLWWCSHHHSILQLLLILRANYSTIVCLLQFSAERFRPPQLESVTAI